MFRRLSVVTLVCSGLLALNVPGSLAAQTPATDLPIAPDPSECTFSDTTYDELQVRVDILVGTPRAFAGEATPEAATEAATPPPRNEPADAKTRRAVTATMREAIACLNTSNPLAFFALISDQLLIESLARGGVPGGPGTETIATPPPLAPEQFVSLMAVRKVTLLPDGRVGALVEMVFPDEGPGVQVDYIVFLNQDGRWVIDLIVSNLETRVAPVSGTPSP